MSPTVDVVTVSPNPTLDRTLVGPELGTGATHRVAAERTAPGGTGINVAAALAGAGYRVAATGWLGAANAELLERFLATRGIENYFVRVPGATGLGSRIAGPAAGGPTSDVDFGGLTPPAAERSLLMERVLGLATGGGWIVMAGSLPPGVDPGFYCELTTLVAGAGAHVLIDTGGEPLRRSLQSEPHILTPNLGELERLVGGSLPARADIVAAARGLLKGSTELVAVSLGVKGALFVTADRAVAATPPEVSARSSAGAGAGMAAGIVAARLRRLPLDETARLASAFALGAVTDRPADAWLERITVAAVP